MKSIMICFAFAILSSCTTYQNFVTVTDRTDIPEGSKEFIVNKSLSSLKDNLKTETIAYTAQEWGIETHEIMLDEGTRAVYNLYALDSATVKVVPYWGYTDKVISEAQIWGGTAATNSMSNEMRRVLYKRKELRPKRVFDYGVQLFGADKFVQ